MTKQEDLRICLWKNKVSILSEFLFKENFKGFPAPKSWKIK